MENENDKGITEELIQEILENVKLELNLTDSSKDDLLTLYIKIICNNLVIYTNRRTFVPDMKYLVVDLVKDKFDFNNSTGTGDTDIQSIQSMSEAGRSVNFGVSSTVANRLNLIAQRQIEENKLLINRFKLLYKT